MERDGLLHILEDRQLALSDLGHTPAPAVMRKHRRPERMLAEIITPPGPEVPVEACRGEHVIREDAGHRLTGWPGVPARCPHGNAIPGPAEPAAPGAAQSKMQAGIEEAGEAMTKAASAGGARVVTRRIGEPIHSDLALMHKVGRAGIQPGREVILMAAGDGVCVTAGSSADLSTVELPRPVAAHLSVSGSSRYRPAAARPAAGA
jgi:DtxR family transcriptional regulator, Mn-dependent transcriptional regulator